jgi:hypothetical protein
MTQTNRTLIEKADLELANLQADGGYLNDQQSDRFIRLLIKKSVLLGMVNVTPMKGPRQEENKTRFAGRVLRPGSPGVALTKSQRAKPDLSQFVLDAKLFKAQVNINDETLEDNIERGVFLDTVQEGMAMAVGRDMEFVTIQGDTASADPLLAVLDGILKQATSNLVNAGSSKLDKDILRDMLKTMPEEFAVVETLKYFTNRRARIDYKDSLANRATALGDANIVQRNTAAYQDMELSSIPEWPNGVSTSALLTDPKNIWVGVHRKVRFERDRDVPAGINIIVGTLRFDTKFEEETASVKAYDIATT